MPTKNPAAVAPRTLTPEERHEIAVMLGRDGGRKTMEKKGREHFSTMGKNSAKARAEKRLSTDKLATSAS